MTFDEYIASPLLGSVVLQLIAVDSSFKDLFIKAAPSITADIESASVNEHCSCKSKVSTYVTMNATAIGTVLYQYAKSTNTLQNVENLFAAIPAVQANSVSGRVAKTTIKEWPGFVKSLNDSNMSYKNISTSVVGEDVYVFFL